MRIGDATLFTGDVLEELRTIPNESINCCVTSPPYWCLRDYGVKGQLGLERTPAEYLDKMVTVFEEVRRVLRKDGTCWINIGDSYAGGGNGARNENRWPKQSRNAAGYKSVHAKKASGLKPKDLCMMPARLAIALQAAGWWLRHDIIWVKNNPMPESVWDRCTKAHEYIFLLTKSARYYWNAEAIKEESSENTHGRGAGINKKIKMPGGWDTGAGTHMAWHRLGREKGERKQNPSFAMSTTGHVERRNKRSVWEIPCEPFPEAHFATYPEKLVEPCILAGCPPDGVVLDPFLGSGTTGAVSLRLGRAFIGIELKPEYMAMAERRIRRAWKNRPSLFAAAEVEPKAKIIQEDFKW